MQYIDLFVYCLYNVYIHRYIHMKIEVNKWYMVTVDCKYIKEIWYMFLYYNNHIKNINMSNVITIWNNFLRNNSSIEKINMPKVINIRDDFFVFHPKRYLFTKQVRWE